MKDETTFRKEKRSDFALQQDYERDRAASSAIKRKFDHLRRYMSPETRPRGKLATRHRGQDITADRLVAVAISEIFRGGSSVRLRTELATGVQYHGINKSLKKSHDKLNGKIILCDDIDPDIVEVHVPRWKDTGDFLKTIGWLLGCIKHFGDNARPFTLNLSDSVIEKASSSPDGFTSYLQKALKRNLSRAYKRLDISTPPEFFFWVEAHKVSRPHLHGVIIFPTEAAQIAVYRAMRDAIKLSGGDWKGPGHQLVVKSFLRRNPFGWAWYVSKLKETTQLNLKIISGVSGNPSTVAVTAGLNRLSKEAYEKARQRGEILSGYGAS